MKNFTFVTVIIAKMYIVQSQQMTRLLESVSEEELRVIALTNPEIKKIYRRHVTYCHIIAFAIIFCLYITGFIYVIDGLYRSHQFYMTHANITATTPKPHPVPFWYPFNKNKYYKLAMAYEIYHITQTLNYNGAAQVLVNSVMVFLVAKLRILQHNVRNINPYDTSDNFKKINAQNTLRECAKQHQELVRWIDKLNCSFQYIILLEYCVISLTLATVIFEILESSSGLSDALYDCLWYDLDRYSKTFIQIMIMRCRKPLTIAIGPFGFMTLDAAVSRIKLTYSVVSVLLTSTN